MQSKKTKRITVVRRGYNAQATDTTFRATTHGPEKDLVRCFLLSESLIVPKGCEAAIFIEPRIETGFPDLVVVIVDKKRLAGWNPKRAKLNAEDFRLLHFLYEAGPLTQDKIENIFGRQVMKRLVRLRNARVLRKKNGDAWMVANLRRIFLAREIIAIEAKINEWKRVISQAVLNTWFASRSIILVSSESRGRALAKRVTGLPVGVWSLSPTPRKNILGTKSSLPRSYVSWLFDEWACRVLRTKTV
jgi:hypothetical protein